MRTAVGQLRVPATPHASSCNLNLHPAREVCEVRCEACMPQLLILQASMQLKDASYVMHLWRGWLLIRHHLSC